MKCTDVLKCLAVPDTALAIATVSWTFPWAQIKVCPEEAEQN